MQPSINSKVGFQSAIAKLVLRLSDIVICRSKCIVLYLIVSGGPGGLLLDTGAGPSFLPLPAPVLEQVAAGNSEPGVTTLRINDPGSRSHQPSTTTSEQCAREIDIEVCFVCKKCRLAFPGESPLLTHQRQCFGGNLENRGAFRIVQTGYECKVCNNAADRFKTIPELKRHCESEMHLKLQYSKAKPSSLPPPSESPLSHEMEDVVNQITLLAARAAQEAGPETAAAAAARVVDSNSNSFCQPQDTKHHRFLAPTDVPQQPLTSAGH